MTHQAERPQDAVGAFAKEFSSRMGSTVKETVLAPVRAVQAAKELTERAMSGEDVSVDPDIGQKALQAVSGAGGLGRALAGGAPKGSIGVFGGRMQQHWNKAFEKLANQAEEAGIGPNTIWKGTGLFRGAEGKWRNEIPDIGFRMIPASEGSPARGKLPQLMEHNDLFKKYPSLKDAEYQIVRGTGGAYLGKNNAGVHQFEFGQEELKNDKGSVLLHEVQHAIQDEEGFAAGGNAAKLMAGPVTSEGRAVQWNIHAFQNYARLSGEVEARNVQKRFVEYLKEHPQLTEEFPRWEQYMSTEAMGMSPTRGLTQFGERPLSKVPGGYDPFREHAVQRGR
jgi:hypothetical protein